MLVAVILTAAGCRRYEPVPPADTVAEDTTTTTAAPIDVSRIPDHITVPYADAVMDALDRVLGDAIRELVRAQGPTRAFRGRLDAIYDEPAFSNKESVFGGEAARPSTDRGQGGRADATRSCRRDRDRCPLACRRRFAS